MYSFQAYTPQSVRWHYFFVFHMEKSRLREGKSFCQCHIAGMSELECELKLCCLQNLWGVNTLHSSQSRCQQRAQKQPNPGGAPVEHHLTSGSLNLSPPTLKSLDLKGCILETDSKALLPALVSLAEEEAK